MGASGGQFSNRTIEGTNRQEKISRVFSFQREIKKNGESKYKLTSVTEYSDQWRKMYNASLKVKEAAKLFE